MLSNNDGYSQADLKTALKCEVVFQQEIFKLVGIVQEFNNTCFLIKLRLGASGGYPVGWSVFDTKFRGWSVPSFQGF